MVGVVLALSAVVALALLGDGPAPPPAANLPDPGTAVPTAAGAPAEPGVVGLMAQLGCQGHLIDTQLYSTQTGRCTLGTAQVTIATFANDQLRDQWVNAASQFGGNLVAGTGWAATASTSDAAGTVASKLGGRRA